MTRQEEAAAEADYYTLLRVPPPPSPLPAQLLRKAYHAALLLHHPDKAPSHRATTVATAITIATTTAATTADSTATTVSVDTITQAYRTLSSPELRAAYNRSLATGMHTGPRGHSSSSGSEVVQTVDLDEFEYRPQSPSRYVRSCRCGEQEGFVLSEDELERAAAEGCGGGGGGHGEVVVGCCGCSLWCRVEFCVIDDDGDA